MKFKKDKPPGWFIQIYDDGTKSQSFTEKNRPGQYAEMMAWVAAGNEIEAFETEDEKAVRLAEEKKQSLLDSKSELLRLIEKNEYHLVSRRQKMIASIQIWENRLDDWNDELDQVEDQIELMNEGKEFSLIDISPEPIFN